jgi:hypothetical protein
MPPRTVFLALVLSLIPSLSMAQEQRADPATAMRRLRLRMLSTPAEQFGIKSSEQCRQVFGVVMDWPVDDETISIVAMCDGNASLYTTGTFGVIGGGKHSSVRRAAVSFVRDAGGVSSDAKPTTDRSYPSPHRVRFYLLTFEGLKVVEDQRASVEGGRSQYAALFERAQELISELRLIADKAQ